ncbi:LPXTG cell wall anchor domain-containing protein [Streptomyces turgidiscabies]|uniref:LPXTG-motif cell wall-anchored protein n=1 Tax=Streptomyces turgidiscabies TaxID=85558 RepID=A0ABU0RFB9_9ACTN|nr:LPXTG cell wall anchor domain-containing protein [Streptomyces turgidiscabies]MDQ0930684.1 LPXTG-motif cell wall-anchored protein [Streptomyces turgidiscabies]
MVVTAAATSVLSLYVIPALAESPPREAPGGTLGALSDTSAVLLDGSVLQILENGPASASPNTGDAGAAPGPSPVNSRIGGPKPSVSQGAAHDSALADGREHGDHGHDSDHVEAAGYGDDSDYGYGDDSGYGDDYGYGDTPPTKPPTTPPVSPPPTTPPVKSPPASPPPTAPAGIPPRKPPASPPTQPPGLPETGANEHVLPAAGIAALLLTSGAILYRRGRAGSRQ